MCDIFAMGRSIHFMFGSRVGFSGLSAKFGVGGSMALFPVAPNSMGYNLGENNARGVIRSVTI